MNKPSVVPVRFITLTTSLTFVTILGLTGPKHRAEIQFHHQCDNVFTYCLPPDTQMNLAEANFAKTVGVSPSSSASDGTICQMSILA